MCCADVLFLHQVLLALGELDLALQATELSRSTQLAILSEGVTLRNGTAVLAYEVDGFGNALFMDDGNSPSLLSLPYLGFISASDPLYQRTRALLLR
jgi:meiotically up-regulated gene 157 (Mug157) protein